MGGRVERRHRASGGARHNAPDPAGRPRRPSTDATRRPGRDTHAREVDLAGYSGKPLAQKLGIKPGARVARVGATVDLGPVPDDVRVDPTVDHPPYDVIVWFVTTRAELEAGFVDQAAKIAPNGGLWLAWPKKASRRPTDLTEDALREVGLPHGLVDNKVCAIDDAWSGLRFVWRLANRPR